MNYDEMNINLRFTKMAKTTPNKAKPQFKKRQTKPPKTQENIAETAPVKSVKKAKNPPNQKHLSLIPEELNKNLNRNQRKKIMHRITQIFKSKGIEDLTSINSKDENLKKFFDRLIKKHNTEAKNKSMKK